MKLNTEKYLLEEAISEAHLVYNGWKRYLTMSRLLVDSEDCWEDKEKMKEAVINNIRECKYAKQRFRVAQRNYARFMREHGKEFGK